MNSIALGPRLVLVCQCVNHLSPDCDKVPEKSHLKKEGFTVAGGKAWRHRRQMAMLHPQSGSRGRQMGAVHLFLCIRPRTPVCKTMPLI